MSGAFFPLFRQRFIPESAWAPEPAEEQQGQQHQARRRQPVPVVKMAALGGGRGLPGGLAKPLALDLSMLARDEAPPSESVLKRQKFAEFEKHCSKVAEGLYVSGEAVARDRGILAAHAISHVVNCVGALYPEHFKAEGIVYWTLWLQDSPQEDITCVLYDVFDFIEAARRGPGIAQQQQQQPPQDAQRPLPPPLQQQQDQQQLAQQQQQPAQPAQPPAQHGGGGGGRVLVHCSQGVSRSTTLAIAYLMWKTGGSYDQVYATVRALRGVTSPNVGFMCQLINWAKRRARPPGRVRLYRLAPHCADAPGYLVAKAVGPRPGAAHADWRLLDPRGCFVAHLPARLYVWRGSACLAAMASAGMRAAAGISRYEGAPPPELVRQGEEPQDLLAALGVGGAGGGPPDASAGHSAASSATSSRPCSAQQQPGEPQQAPQAGEPPQQQQQQHPPPPWQLAAAGIPTGGRPSSAPASGKAGDVAAGAAAVQRLQGEQQRQQEQALLPLVSLPELDEYSAHHDLWLRALHKSGGGGGGEAGRLTPRSPLAGLAADDLPAGAGGRANSPASVEGRVRKYRKSGTESGRTVVPSVHLQPGGGFLGCSLGRPGEPAAAAAAAAAASCEAAQGDIKRMSIDEAGG